MFCTSNFNQSNLQKILKWNNKSWVATFHSHWLKSKSVFSISHCVWALLHLRKRVLTMRHTMTQFSRPVLRQWWTLIFYYLPSDFDEFFLGEDDCSQWASNANWMKFFSLSLWLQFGYAWIRIMTQGISWTRSKWFRTYLLSRAPD